MRVLILGGTTEASALARLLAGDARFDAILSLAGRTAAPKAQPIATRSGGFGGIEGLSRWLRDQATEAAIDATHPYADQMSAHAVAACAQADVPLASVLRPAWTPQPGDAWHLVADAEAAAAALGQAPRRVFLSLGRSDLDAFATAPQHHYVARSVDPPEQLALPPDMSFLQARGPFDLDAETKLLIGERIEIIVSKNSGGSATYPKIAAARALGLPVVMIARPHKPAGQILDSAEAAIAWLKRIAAHGPSRRGV
jgi:precorrin-6A/cobalt-precorrin-6A reductase